MVFSSYYKFEHLTGTKAYTRVECTASTGDYKPLENLRTKKARKASEKIDACFVGQLTLRLCKLPSKYKVDPDRIPSIVLVKNTNVSSIKGERGFLESGVFTPDYQDITFGYGDMNGTPDGFLFVLKDVEFTNGRLKDGATIEIFVAPHQARTALNLWQSVRMRYPRMLAEMAALRAKAKIERYGNE